jgi:hypothetical protein
VCSSLPLPWSRLDEDKERLSKVWQRCQSYSTRFVKAACSQCEWQERWSSSKGLSINQVLSGSINLVAKVPSLDIMLHGDLGSHVSLRHGLLVLGRSMYRE